jgi:DNA topoisomerase-2
VQGPKEFLASDPIVNGSDDYCDFTVTFTSKDILDKFINDGTLETKLKLSQTISTSNMYLFDENDSISKYNTVNDILSAFCEIRLSYYKKRRDYELEELLKELRKLKNQLQFLTLIHNKTIVLDTSFNVPKVTEQLKKLIPNLEDEEYTSLLRMNFIQLAQEEISKHKAKIAVKENAYNALNAKTDKQMWLEDLHMLAAKIEEFDRMQIEEKMAVQSLTQKVTNKGKTPHKTTTQTQKVPQKPATHKTTTQPLTVKTI